MEIRKVVTSYAISILNSTICLMQCNQGHQNPGEHFGEVNNVPHTLTYR